MSHRFIKHLPTCHVVGETINLPGLPTTGPPPLSYVAVPGEAQPSSISITPLNASRQAGSGPGQTPSKMAPGNSLTRLQSPSLCVLSSKCL